MTKGDSAARIRDGEIVGAGAPELGADNRGRTMLEKMGWSSGMALGALDNKGILQPVTQTMKRSKAGLG
ncbi:Protein SQS1 [Escovopsis weberi]|uniref:Protein SQS1 n=1 Tax=Escovopsis weberi TaxID=150374 RepID=A0A0N0RT30_ESCWE|nr:Protein SQS1 [Escovopsis weberi]